MIFICYKDFKTPNITQFGALACQIKHMAALWQRLKNAAEALGADVSMT
jgi:hypothetical protein